MSWREPMWWLGLVGVVLLLAAVIAGGLRHRALLREVFGGELFERVLPRRVRVRRTVRDVLVLVGLALTVIALVEPLYGKEVQQVDSKGVDIAVAVDLSLSMDATDVSPSRVGRARREILDLMDVMEGDRLGLVIFAGGAFPRLPLTTDIDAIELVVNELATDMFAAQGSEIGPAIRTGLQLLDGVDRPAGKAILILSDGETHDPADALAAAREAAELDVRVYGLLIGQGPAPIPTARGALTSGGTTVMTRPEPDVLRDIARITGGALVESVASNDDTITLYRDEIRSRLVAATSATMQRETWRTGYQWPLGIGLVCLLLAALLGEGRRKWGAAAAVFLAVHSVAHAGPLEDGDALYRDGDFRGASEVFTEMTIDDPGNVEAWQRLGASRHKQGDFDGAARAFDRAVDLGAGADAQFNAGNAHYLAGRLGEAMERYESLLRDGDHPGARHNLDILTQELMRRMQMQPPPPPEPQQGEQDPEEGEDSDSGEEQESEGQDGEDPQEQEGQQGEQSGDQGGEQGGQGEPGEQEGDPQDGEGESEPGEPSDANAEGQANPEDQELGERDDNGTADLSEGDGSEGEQEGSGAAAAGGQGEGDETGPVTRTQAERLLDGVEEGRPRVRIPGQGSSKPW